MIRVFRIYFPASIIGLLVSECMLTLFCYTITSLLIYNVDPYVDLFYEGGMQRILLVSATVILGVYYADLYNEVRVRSRTVLIQQFCLITGAAFFGQALVGYINRNLVLPRWHMIYGSALALAVLPAWRMVYAELMGQREAARRVLFLGGGEMAEVIAERMSVTPQLGLASAGYLDEQPSASAPPALGPYLGPVTKVTEVARELHPELLVAALPERRGRLPVYDLLDLRLSGVMVEEAATVYERVFGRVSVSTLRPSHLIFSSALGPNPMNVALQNLYSRALALLGLIVTAPLMLLVAVLIRLTTPGQAIHRQRRVGRNGAEFWLFKFRSMFEGAEAESGAVWAQPDDPRITPVGRWLRKLRIDELPQFVNVLRGQMSIVGPRPERPEFVQTLSEQIPFYRQRHCVKPGITGWAQINHPYSDSVEDTVSKLEYDLYYIKNLSPALDAYILFQTAKVMLQLRGSR